MSIITYRIRDKRPSDQADQRACRFLATNKMLKVGCTSAEVNSITGMSIQMIERYSVARNRAKIAVRAMEKWVGEER